MFKPLVLLEEKVAVVILNHKLRASRLRSHCYHKDEDGGDFYLILSVRRYVQGWRGGGGQ